MNLGSISQPQNRYHIWARFLLCLLISFFLSDEFACSQELQQKSTDVQQLDQTPSPNPPENIAQGARAQHPLLEKIRAAKQRNMRRGEDRLSLDDADPFLGDLPPIGTRFDDRQRRIKIPNHETPNYCAGGILPSGQFSWVNCPKQGQRISGQVPNPTLQIVPGDEAEKLAATSAVNDPLYEHMVSHTIGLPVHAHSAAITAALNEVYRNSLAVSPEDQAALDRQIMQTRKAQEADNAGVATQKNFKTITDWCHEFLINVANEDAGTPTDSKQVEKPLSGAVWMVQQMYHRLYLPMAILLLLPGAALTQLKGMVAFGILGTNDEDTVSPFAGLMRAMIAVFLIPATQLTLSCCIDLGNSMKYEVTRELEKEGRIERIHKWIQQQAFATAPKNMQNYIKNEQENDRENVERGKVFDGDSTKSRQERQNNITVNLQHTFNTANHFASLGIVVLNAFQVVLVCYLFLLGPVAGALYAWPSSVGKDLFRRTFSSWLDGVVLVCLWKFWWCVVLLCMAVRLEVFSVQDTAQFEMFYFTAFVAILTYVPFHPFDFRPGDLVSDVLSKGLSAANGRNSSPNGGNGPGERRTGEPGSLQTTNAQTSNSHTSVAPEQSGRTPGATIRSTGSLLPISVQTSNSQVAGTHAGSRERSSSLPNSKSQSDASNAAGSLPPLTAMIGKTRTGAGGEKL